MNNDCREEKRGCEGCAYYKDNIIFEISKCANWHINHITETIKDYIDDDKIKNASFIGELKEEREQWRDIIRIIDNEKLILIIMLINRRTYYDKSNKKTAILPLYMEKVVFQ